eukprot:271202-Hanusia_phi.AAC.1
MMLPAATGSRPRGPVPCRTVGVRALRRPSHWLGLTSPDRTRARSCCNCVIPSSSEHTVPLSSDCGFQQKFHRTSD